MIRPRTDADIPAIDVIINEAAEAYRGVLPADCWHEPYMSRPDLLVEIEAGVSFSGWSDREDAGAQIGVMGLQMVRDATLIRHAYVRPSHQGRGIGSALLNALTERADGQLLIGTWAAASWAIRLYQRHGFELVTPEDRDRLLDTYWKISARQRETSVVLRKQG